MRRCRFDRPPSFSRGLKKRPLVRNNFRSNRTSRGDHTDHHATVPPVLYSRPTLRVITTHNPLLLPFSPQRLMPFASYFGENTSKLQKTMSIPLRPAPHQPCRGPRKRALKLSSLRCLFSPFHSPFSPRCTRIFLAAVDGWNKTLLPAAAAELLASPLLLRNSEVTVSEKMGVRSGHCPSLAGGESQMVVEAEPCETNTTKKTHVQQFPPPPSLPT